MHHIAFLGNNDVRLRRARVPRRLVGTALSLAPQV